MRAKEDTHKFFTTLVTSQVCLSFIRLLKKLKIIFHDSLMCFKLYN